MPQTQAIVDSTVLDEVVHWIKSLTAVGVSPDTAATITSQFFLAACEMIAEESDDDDEDVEFEE